MAQDVLDHDRIGKASAYEHAAALLWRDRTRALIALVILSIPSAAALLQPPGSSSIIQLVFPVQAAIKLVLLYYLGTRAVAHATGKPLRQHVSGLVSLFFVGFFLWILLYGTSQLTVLLANSNIVALAGLLITALAAFVYYRLYFFYFPFLEGKQSPLEAVKKAWGITRQNWKLPLIALFGPFVLSSFLQACFLLLSPDGRHAAVLIAASSTQGVQWLLSLYLGIALCFRELLPDSLAGISFQFPPVLEMLQKLLHPRNAAKALIVVVLLWLGNVARLQEMPPAVQHTIQSIRVNQSTVELSLSLSDPEFVFRGYMPSRFRLAGEAGSPVSTGMVDFEFDRGPQPYEARLLLRFTTDRKERELIALEDLYLWYSLARLDHLDMSEAGHGPDQERAAAPAP